MKNKWEVLSLGPLPFIYSLQYMFVSQILCLEGRTTLAAHSKSGVPSVCSALGCVVARRGLEARGGFNSLTESLWPWKQTQEEILLPLAIVPLLILKDVLS